MGFTDRAKQMAEQAQRKLDGAQKTFNDKQTASHAPPAAPPAEAARPAPAPPAGEPQSVSEADRGRIAPPPLSSGDPLNR